MTAETKEKYFSQLHQALKDLKEPSKIKNQIPNLLTASRLLSPLLILPAAATGNIALAAYAAAGFGFTDLIDGFLARRWNVKSELGAALDAFADKIFGGTLLLAGSLFNPILLLNMALELGIAGVNIRQTIRSDNYGSTTVGKFKTWFLFGLGALGLAAPALSLNPVVIPALALTTAALQTATIASYVKAYSKPIDTKNVKKGHTLQEPLEDEVATSAEYSASYQKTTSGMPPLREEIKPTQDQIDLAEKIIALEEQGIEVVPTGMPRLENKTEKVYTKK